MEPKKLNLATISDHLATPDKAREYVESLLWPNGPVCPNCKSMNGTRLVSRPESKHKVRAGLVKCRDCGKKYTVTQNTIFESTHIGLDKWLMAIFLICSAKKAISSHQIHRSLGVTQKTVWFMMHRIRYAMEETSFPLLAGTVEMDETYIGGREHVRPAKDDKPAKTGWTNKTAVVSLVDRATGNKRSVVMKRVTARNLAEVLAAHVEEGATVNTDESTKYRKIMAKFRHKGVKHMANEYVRREGDELVTTNYVESTFSLLKRGLIGAFHHLSAKHLHRYCSEFDFRWNRRRITDGERTVANVMKVVGKRLTYRRTHSEPEKVSE